MAQLLYFRTIQHHTVTESRNYDDSPETPLPGFRKNNIALDNVKKERQIF